MCGLIDLDSGEATLFGYEPTLSDSIWSGKLPTLTERAFWCGVERIGTIDNLNTHIGWVLDDNRRVHIPPPYQAEVKIKLASLLNIDIKTLSILYSPELIFTLAEMREVKSAEEIEAIDEAYEIGARMQLRAMELCREGVVEATISGELEGMARAEGLGVSFAPITTQHGERLHNVERWGVLESGRLFLCDSGVQARSGYCSDHTRTYPVNGKFTNVQRDIYSVALAAHNHITSICLSGVAYNELKSECYRIIGDGLRGLGFLRGSDEAIAESGAVSLFMPHGVGHGLGLDVHDCQAFGERSFDLTPYKEFAQECRSCIIRSQWILHEGTVLTNEPGIYFIPELIESKRAEGVYNEVVNFEMVERHLDFGGIRIEDDLIVTSDGCRKSGSNSDLHIPISVEEF